MTGVDTEAERQQRGGSAGATPAPAAGVRIELVDNWHGDWKRVLGHIRQTGRPDRLRVDADGWLSARQVVLAATDAGGAVAGHVCFSVTPTPGQGIDAHLDSHGIDPAHRGKGTERELRAAAIERANELRCRRLIGFDLPEQW